MEVGQLRKGHLRNHSSFLHTLFSVSKNQAKTRSCLQSANSNQLKCLVRILHSVVTRRIRLQKDAHKAHLAKYMNEIRAIVRRYGELLRERRQVILQVLIGISPILRWVVLPLFCPPDYLDGDESGVGAAGGEDVDGPGAAQDSTPDAVAAELDASQPGKDPAASQCVNPGVDTLDEHSKARQD